MKPPITEVGVMHRCLDHTLLKKKEAGLTPDHRRPTLLPAPLLEGGDSGESGDQGIGTIAFPSESLLKSFQNRRNQGRR